MSDLLRITGSGMRKRITLVSTGQVIEDIKDFTIGFESNLWNISSQHLEATIGGRIDLDSTDIKVELGLWDMNVTQDPTDEQIEWYDFGTFVIARDGYEYSDNLNQTTITKANDLLVKSHAEYKPKDMNVKYPASIKTIVTNISRVIGVPLFNADWHNSNHLVEEDKWANNQYTYNDILREVAEFCNLTISIEQDKIKLKNIIQTSVKGIIDGGEKTMKNERKWGKPNILNLTSEPQHYNYPYPLNWETIPLEDRVELNFTNNQIIEKRKEELAPQLFESIKDIEYVPFEYTGFGYLTMKFGDLIQFKDKDGNTYQTYVTYGEWKATSGFQETLGSEVTPNAAKEYVTVSDKRRQGIKVALKVDQQEAKITSAIEAIGDREDKETSLTQDVDSINAKVQSISVGTNLILNLNATLDMVNNTYPYYIFNQNGLQTVFQTIQQTRHMGSPIFRVVADKNSVSGYSKQYEFKGKALATEYAYIVPDTIYSYRCKRTKGNTPMDVYVVEYDADKKQIKRTKFTLNGQNMIESFSFTPAQMTMWVRLEFYNNIEEPFNIAEEMFVRGEPVKWSEDASEVKAWTQAQLTIRDDSIQTLVERVGTNEEGLSEAKSQINQQADDIELKVEKNGVIGAINVSEEGLKISSGKLEFDNAKGNDVDLTGKLTAESGKIGSFDINGGNLKGDDVELRPKEIQVGGATLNGAYLENVNGLEIKTKRLRIGSGDTPWIWLGSKPFIKGLDGTIHLNASTILPFDTWRMIGQADNRWSHIYLQNQPNVSSDRKLKYNITNIDDILLDSFEPLYEKYFKTKHDNKHSFGYVAQDVESCLETFVYQVWDEEEASVQMDKFKLLSRDGDHMSLLYAEVQVIMQAVERRHRERLEIEVDQLRREHDTLVEILKEKGVI